MMYLFYSAANAVSYASQFIYIYIYIYIYIMCCWRLQRRLQKKKLIPFKMYIRLVKDKSTYNCPF